LGVDVHAFTEDGAGRKLVLGGVEIPFERGLLGHSDADVLAHAVTDALLGAAGLETSATTSRHRRALQGRRLPEAFARMPVCGWRVWEVSNVDAVVICERPKIRDYRRKCAGTWPRPWASNRRG
jgi:2-C-methyl-D-erythritol 2,4-cyclodiphosphate synthase